MNNERLFGMETEYGLSVFTSGGVRLTPEGVAGDLVHLARQDPHLPGLHSSGLFFPNGSRLYVDCGTHPEICTPECANPWDVCRYVQAGEQLLLSLVGRLGQRGHRVERAMILRSNVDLISRATWGIPSRGNMNPDKSTLGRKKK